jgi:hypothetical protein
MDQLRPGELDQIAARARRLAQLDAAALTKAGR